MKKAMTIHGPVPADQLGHTLTHEHILAEVPDWGVPPMYPELLDHKVTIDILGKLRRDFWSCKDNLRLDEPEVSLQEVASFKAKGGRHAGRCNLHRDEARHPRCSRHFPSNRRPRGGSDRVLYPIRPPGLCGPADGG